MIKKIKYNKGYVILLNTLLFIAISLIVIIGAARPIVLNISSYRAFSSSNKSFLDAHSAVNEAYYRLDNGMALGTNQTISFASSSANIIVENVSLGKKITVTADQNGYQRKIELNLGLGTGIAFYYGIQAGNGGFLLQNSSSIVGNAFSAGSVVGSGNYIYGDVVSTGSSGMIDHIHATGTAYAHTINNAIIDKNAYYVALTGGTTVGGTKYPNSPDLEPVDMPISDAQISQWESDAAAGGSVTCSGGTYTISSNVTIGPKKIPCDLKIKTGNTQVTLGGHIWVTGNIDVENGADVRVASSLGAQSVAIIADNPSNRLTSSIARVNNTSSFSGSGTPGSFIFLISQNNSAETGGPNTAISLSNGSDSMIAYARHGKITVGNNVDINEATGYKIELNSSAKVTYDSGLPSTLFSSGPSGGYSLISWKEI